MHPRARQASKSRPTPRKAPKSAARALTPGEARRQAVSRRVETLFAERHGLMRELAAVLIALARLPPEDDRTAVFSE